MSQQVQELIDKIKKDGVQEAEQKAKDIQSQATQKAEVIVNEAKQHAEKLIANAEAESKKVREATHMALKQASRDMLLKLREEIESNLMSIVSNDINKALTPQTLSELIQAIVKGSLKEDISDITVTLSQKDLKLLKDGFITKLKDKIKKPMTFQSADDISAGFTISFDQGKSCFDFTDASLVEYLSSYLNAEVSSLLKETV